MAIFYSDLDNTLIYSYRHDIGEKKRCVEWYQGHEQAFLSEKTYQLLRRLSKKILIVPTTTRTVEQYKRIDLGVGILPYALTCNGGVLLINGEKDEEWYQKSLELAADCYEEMQKAVRILQEDSCRSMEVKYIEKLFLYTKSEKPETTVFALRDRLDLSLVEVITNHAKVYVVPKALNKGKAAERLQDKIGKTESFAAGDSVFDIPMLEYADYAFAPEDLDYKKKKNGVLNRIHSSCLFSEVLLEKILETIE